MTEIVEQLNPAEEASRKALAEVYGCLERKESFLVEAGAGAGKTYTLVKALHFLISNSRTPRKWLKHAHLAGTFS
ncbi:MAG: hypothetical protein SCH98_08775 [Deferrisomatales bacterium]|nr:hypothetical protein [Deferrisomatales bacterium]